MSLPLLPALVLGSILLLFRPKKGEGKAVAVAPRFTPGPGNLGRIYGVPTLDPPPEFWASNGVSVGPDCSWVIEADHFLPSPPPAVLPPPTDTLAAALQSSNAWAFVHRMLLVNGTLPDFSAMPVEARAVLAINAAQVILDYSGPDCSGIPTAGSPLESWRNDLAGRIRAWIDGQLATPRTTSTRFAPGPATRRAAARATFVPGAGS